VGLDDSPHARAAIAAAVVRAARLGARVDGVIAYEIPRYWSELYADMVLSPDEQQLRALERGRRIVAEVVRRAGVKGDAVSVRAVEGPSGPVLIREAVGARLLVVGSHSRNPLEGLVLGSVALACVTSAPCPLMVVRLRPDGAPYGEARSATTAASLAG
jgi:nucleotide-binding universal stress UspA family protein